MVFLKLLCRMFGHQPNRHRVWFDELDYRSRCKRCDTEMVRDLHGWREFDPEADADPRRRARRQVESE
jgi:hypothetical protein